MPISRHILFAIPPSGLYRRDDRCQSRVEDQTVQVILPPIDLAYGAAVACRQGWEATIRDFPAEGADWKTFREMLHSASPECLLFNTTAATAVNDLEAAGWLRQARPEALIVARGESLSHSIADTLRQWPAVDVIAWGETEAVIPDLLEAAQIKSDGGDWRARLTETAGVAFRADRGTIHVAEQRAMVADLDALPYPARDLLDNQRYRSPETGAPLTVIQAHRGCPSRCVFCPAGAISGYRVRFRSPARIVEEIAACVQTHGIREFLFSGDTFTIKKSWVIELCRLLVEARLPIRWGCNSRLDTMDAERAEWLARAGCAMVAFGVESGSQTMLDKMGKGARVERAFEAVEHVRRAGMMTHTFYIIGLPWETAETLRETYEFARALDADFFDFNVATPLPGTALWDLAVRDALFEGGAPTAGAYSKAVIRSYGLSSEELTQWRRRALLKLTLRPSYIWRTLRRIRSPRVFLNYVRAAHQRLKALLTQPADPKK